MREGDRRGYERMLKAFWDAAADHGVELPTAEPVSRQAFSAARRRLPADHVRDLMRHAAVGFDDTHGAAMRWHGRRLLAVDGACRNVQASDELVRLCGRPQGAHYPQVHVSTLFDVVAEVPVDVEVGRFCTDERGCDFLGRIPATKTCTAMVDFVASGRKEAWIVLTPPRHSSARELGPIRVRALRVPRRDGAFWVLLTSFDEKDFPFDTIVDGYTRRWRVEEHYKLLVAPYFRQGMFHARYLDGVRQEIYAQMLFVVLARHLAAVAADRHEVDYHELSQKAVVLAVGDHLTRLVLARPIETARRDLERLMRRIARAREKPRPGRSAPRRSLQPQARWGPKGRRGRD